MCACQLEVAAEKSKWEGSEGLWVGVLIVSRVVKEVTEEVILSGTEGPAVEHQGACKEAQEWGKALEQGCPRTGSGGRRLIGGRRVCWAGEGAGGQGAKDHPDEEQRGKDLGGQSRRRLFCPESQSRW